MSRLEELIQELCPNGVEYKKLGDTATILRGASPRPIKNFITTDEDGVNWIKIGDVAQGSKYVMRANEKITEAGAKKSRRVKPGDFILSNSMSFGRPYILKIDGCVHDGWLIISDYDNNYLPDFLYHLLNSTSVQQEMAKRASFGGAVQNLNSDIVKALVLPVPPLEVQREIVRILDSFTLLTAKLTAELTARKKQYEYYRDMLLTFDVRGGATSYVAWRTLGEICDVRDGTHDSPKPSLTGKYLITSKNVKNGTIDCTGAYLISDKDYEQINVRSKVDTWDILFTMIGTIGEIGMVAHEPDFAIKNVGLIKTGNELLSRFLRHYLVSDKVKAYIDANRSKGTQAFLALGKLRELPVPVVSEPVMKNLVHVLDNFDAICSDLNIGLPAEIEARQKQYEFYRDKLLSFKQL